MTFGQIIFLAVLGFLALYGGISLLVDIRNYFGEQGKQKRMVEQCVEHLRGSKYDYLNPHSIKAENFKAVSYKDVYFVSGFCKNPDGEEILLKVKARPIDDNRYYFTLERYKIMDSEPLQL